MSMTNAERQKAYRERQKEKGIADNRIHRLEEWRERNPQKYAEQKQRRKGIDAFNRKVNRVFFGVDGEGITKEQGYLYKEELVYDHKYTLLSAYNEQGEGSFIENYKGLSTEECLEFFLELKENYPNAIFVGFVTNYDINKILCDLNKEECKKLWDEGFLEIEDYSIIWIPSKIFSVTKNKVTFTLYDTFGFFQKSFIKALEEFEYNVPDKIKEGKENRKRFSIKEKKAIREYNKQECILLAQMMGKLRGYMLERNFLPDKWHGAGAIASTIFRQKQINEYNYNSEAHFKNIIAAYYGGRNQILWQGELGDVWIHDINSAYPHAASTLPTSYGTWERIQNPNRKKIYEWGLHKVEWNVDSKITPFPFRRQGRIYWTQKGIGYYWSPEVSVAKEYFGSKIKILETWQFRPYDNTQRPFEFLNEMYAQRLQLLKENNQSQLVLKLGLNAVYGKLAQGTGYKGSIPRYRNYFWAGYITSITRARMLSLALTDQKNVVSFSTDGLVSKTQLVPELKEKVFGEWEVKQLKNFFILQSGVYDYTTENERKYKSRGFGAKNVDYDALRELWRKEGIYGEFEYNETRFVGMGIALRTDFNLWGRWQEQHRKISFWPIGEFDSARKRNWTCHEIFPPEVLGEESESYKLKAEKFESDEQQEYLSQLDQP